MVKITLAPGEVEKKAVRTKQIIAYLLALIIILVAGGVFFGIKTATSSTKGKIESLNTDINNIKKSFENEKAVVKEIVTFQKELKNLRVLLNNHIGWYGILKSLEAKTLKNDLQVTNLEGEAGKPLTVKGKALNLVAIAKFMEALKTMTPHVASVELISARVLEQEKDKIAFEIKVGVPLEDYKITKEAIDKIAVPESVTPTPTP